MENKKNEQELTDEQLKDVNGGGILCRTMGGVTVKTCTNCHGIIPEGKNSCPKCDGGKQTLVH